MSWYPTSTRRSSGVALSSVVARSARYCRYADVAPTLPPVPGSDCQPVHVPSGVGVSPVRTLSATDVPAGVATSAERSPQARSLPSPSTRDVNVPAEAYGLRRSQSTRTVLVLTKMSLTTGRMFAPIGVGCVATSAPSA